LFSFSQQKLSLHNIQENYTFMRDKTKLYRAKLLGSSQVFFFKLFFIYILYIGLRHNLNFNKKIKKIFTCNIIIINRKIKGYEKTMIHLYLSYCGL